MSNQRKFPLELDGGDLDSLVNKLSAKDTKEWTGSNIGDGRVYSTNIREYKVDVTHTTHSGSNIDPAGGGYDDWEKHLYRIEVYGDNPIACSKEVKVGKIAELFKKVNEEYYAHLIEIEEQREEKATEDLRNLLDD